MTRATRGGPDDPAGVSDPGGRGRAAAARRRRAEDFDTPVVASRWRALYATALRVRAGGSALADELADALAARAALAAALSGADAGGVDGAGADGTGADGTGADGTGADGAGAAAPGWAAALAEAARAAARTSDTAAQSRLTAVVRSVGLPPGVHGPLVRSTETVRDLRALLNDRSRRDGAPTVELDDDAGGGTVAGAVGDTAGDTAGPPGR